MFDDELRAEARALVELYAAKKLTLATAESCTGGLLAGLITEIAGSSAVLERGFVVYSNAAKAEMLGVSKTTLEHAGAVSAETARELVAGALDRSRADIAVAITGVAGPGGGSADKPVGLVHFACGGIGGQITHAERRFGDIGRGAVRRAAIVQALVMLAAAAAQARP